MHLLSEDGVLIALALTRPFFCLSCLPAKYHLHWFKMLRFLLFVGIRKFSAKGEAFPEADLIQGCPTKNKTELQ